MTDFSNRIKFLDRASGAIQPTPEQAELAREMAERIAAG